MDRGNALPGRESVPAGGARGLFAVQTPTEGVAEEAQGTLRCCFAFACRSPIGSAQQPLDVPLWEVALGVPTNGWA